MRGIPYRYAHFVFGVIQSGLTSAVASAVASVDYLAHGEFGHWISAWLVAWVLMLPLVVAAAPIIRRMALFLTDKADASRQS